MEKEKDRERSLWRFGRYNGQSKPNSENPRFEYVRLGEKTTPAEFRNARGKGWRFFWRSEPEGQKNTTRTLHGEKPFM